MKILFFGWFIKNRNGDGIVRAFESLGNVVYKVAMDTQLTNELSPHDLHIRSYYGDEIYWSMVRREQRVNCLQILKEKCPEADCVYIYQTSVSMNTQNIPIPVIYYHHEVLLPCIPDGRIDMIFYNYHGCKEQLMKIYHDRLWQIPFIQSTFGMELDRYTYSDKKRNIFMGFKGAFAAYNADNDMAMEGIYINRNRFLKFARNNCECHIEGYITNPNEMDELIYFLKQCSIAINISGCIGDWGFCNERMFVAMAVGCVLLHHRFPKIESLGLIDFENCLLFSDEFELYEKYEWAKSHPNELEGIRIKGHELVIHNFDHIKTVKIQLESINAICDGAKLPQCRFKSPIHKLSKGRQSKIERIQREWYEWFQRNKKNPELNEPEPIMEK